MARVARVFVPGSGNHIVNRGVSNVRVFRDDDDFRHCSLLIHKYKLKYGCLIYSYCLMPTHIHFLLESSRGMKAMSSFMHDLNQSYAMRFNAKYERHGHLWQNRYKNFVVLKDKYLINLISYIEFNPVRAGLVKNPEDYPWSSYRGRVLGKKDIIIDVEGQVWD